MVPREVLEAWSIRDPVHELAGGCQQVFRAGNRVIKRVLDHSLESQHSVSLALWLADVLETVPRGNFRLSRPIRTKDGRWMLADGWMAWSYLEGEKALTEDTPRLIESVQGLHEALKSFPENPLLKANETAWGYAHYHCFRSMPEDVHPLLSDLVSRLYDKCRPLPGLECQLIHGDLNLGNIMVAPGMPAGFIDFTPFWAPAEFALAMFANWAGPRAGQIKVLDHFKNIRCFDQLLLRASIRMLLIVSRLNGVDRCETEKKAARLVLSYVG